jgi:hypothetical protein
MFFFCREKIVNIKEKIRQISIEAGALAIRKVKSIENFFKYRFLF